MTTRDSRPPRTLYFVVTGAPLTRFVHHGIAEARAAGWQTAVVATAAALSWLDREELERVGVALVTDHREPGMDKRLPRPDAVVLAPGTFNTVNKLAAGIADTYALSVLCESLGERRAMVVVPFVKRALAGHPAWGASLETLRRAGVQLVNPHTGDIGAATPIESGTGDAVAAAFQWRWVLDALPVQGP
ncbi:flavoprotein [Jiangella endophytica]|uniref:flavoprotein n=1 Tax=Jiangella endophytica TaxID=1623398 RepID=UPI00130030CF|nr:flavoprotein [Jiangella endophytica]